MTPREATLDLIREVIWWHAQMHDDPLLLPVNLEEVMRKDRRRHVCLVRDDCIHRVKAARPNMSTPAIGRLFDRDHSSIMAALDREKSRAKYRREYERKRLKPSLMNNSLGYDDGKEQTA